MATIEELEEIFDDHPSLDASLQDFEPPGSSEMDHQNSPRFGYPSHHSGFRSSDSGSDQDEESISGGRYSPPAWRREGNGNRSSGFWNTKKAMMGSGYEHHSRLLGQRGREESYDSYQSREGTPNYESADDGGEDATLAAAARTRLPTGSVSPEKRRSPSPDPYPRGNQDFGDQFGGDVKFGQQEDGRVVPESPNNCKQFSLFEWTGLIESRHSIRSQSGNATSNRSIRSCLFPGTKEIK